MKWTISQQKLRNPNGLDFDNLDPNEKQHFEPVSLTKDDKNDNYLSDDLRKELEGRKYGIWAVYELGKNFKPKEKRKYETFCGGFLYFNDGDLLEYLKELSSKSDKTGVKVDVKTLTDYFKEKGLVQNSQNTKLQLDHKIFFEWGKGDKATDENGDPLNPDKEYVRIYISPPAGNPDPPRPPGPPPPESSQ
ncbi:MAG: hypothetical protein ACHQYQ_11260 [Bacteriovoracales bacterium]